MKPLLICLTLAFISVSCSSNNPPLAVASNFQAAKYQGVWHEVARLPNRFEKGIIAAKATYGLQRDGSLSVQNNGLKSNGKQTSITGKATPVSSAKLKVRFDRFPANLFAGDYWVLKVNEAHTMAMVGSPSRKYLWLLAKDPTVTAANFTDWLTEAKSNSFATDTIIENPERIK